MFDPLPENARSLDVAEARSRALARAWRYFRLMATLACFPMGAIALLFGLAILMGVLLSRPWGPAVHTLSGTVVGIRTARETSRSRSGSPTYAPIVRFGADGQDHEFTGRMYTENRSRWTVGQSVPVLYDPVSGRTAIGGSADFEPPLELTFIGSGLLLLGTVLWRRRWWERPGLF